MPSPLGLFGSVSLVSQVISMPGVNHSFTSTKVLIMRTKDSSPELTPGARAVLSIGATACVVGAVAGVTIQPEDIGNAAQQASETVKSAVRDYLGTDNCNQ